MESSRLVLTAIHAIRKAGALVRRGFGTTFQVSTKSCVHDLVTEFDHKSEALIWETLQAEFPESGLLGEECGSIGPEDAELVWVVDPIDGTTNFARSIPIFAISIAAVVDGAVQAGVVYQPITEELFIAERGKGATLNGEPLAVSKTNEIESAFVTTSISESAPPLTQEMRALGSAVLNLAYTAAGRFDAFWSSGWKLSPWDIAAGSLLVEEAGGVITQCSGKPIDPLHRSDVLAANPHLHPHLLGVRRTALDSRR